MEQVALTLGPLFFHWQASKIRDFYFHIADEAAVDRVHVGEVVCGKRMPFSDQVWPEIIERLERAGKEVVLSTLAAPATVRERKTIAELCSDGRLVEINDVTALPSRSSRAFVTGPFFNVYNEGTARFLQRHGATTICPPVELSLDLVAILAGACTEIEFELFAFGRLPLALSGRCYHARLHGLHKDGCQFTCEQDPDGLAVDTLDDQPFLAINGVQTLSAGVHAALFEPAMLIARDIRRLRLSPHDCDMAEVISIYRAVLDGREDADGARQRLACIGLPGQLVDGYVHGVAGAQLAMPA